MGEERFDMRERLDIDEIQIHPEIKAIIENVSKAWNDMILTAIEDDAPSKNPIVTMLQKDGAMEPLSDSLQKLFALNW
jgi:hypothetical protein